MPSMASVIAIQPPGIIHAPHAPLAVSQCDKYRGQPERNCSTNRKEQHMTWISRAMARSSGAACAAAVRSCNASSVWPSALCARPRLNSAFALPFSFPST